MNAPKVPKSYPSYIMSPRLRNLMMVVIVLSMLLLLALAWATRNTASFVYNYTLLLYLNLAVIIVMTVLLLFMAHWLYLRWRRNLFGMRLLTRFAFSFLVLAIVPSFLLFLISTVFVSRTIDSWFHSQVDSALAAGIDFGRDRLLRNRDLASTQLNAFVQNEHTTLNTAPNPSKGQTWLKEHDWQTLMVLDAQGNTVWRIDTAGQGEESINAHLPKFSANLLGSIQKDWSEIEDEYDTSTEDSTQIPRQYLHNINRIQTNTTPLWVYTQKIMPLEFSQRVNTLQAGQRDYQAIETSRDSLRLLYRVTLTMTLLVTLLAALAAAFLIANRMIAPILWLAQATRQVAQGHYALIPPRVQGSDEMLELVDSFGDMAQQIHVSQSSLAHKQQELESEKAYSEAVFDNLSSAVLVFNQELQLLSFNQTAQHIFHTDFKNHLHAPLHEITPLTALHEAITEHIHRHAQRLHNKHDTRAQSWRIQQSLTNPISPRHDDITVSIQASCFKDEDESYSWVLVCDDVTPIISAQRTLAWGEVARRLAHEIKNPLTPIQLSAERLYVKLADKLAADDFAQLEKGTRTIINQVAALQNMVDEFRDYARTPESRFSVLDLNALIEEILVLYEAQQGSRYTIQAQLAQRLPSIWADAQQLRQVLHNLIKNAIEAHTDNSRGLPHIDIHTECVALSSEHDTLLPNQAVRLTITDNGAGFTDAVLARMFEPYNSNKNHGTGLGLPIVKKIMDAHHAQIQVKNIIEKSPEQKILGAQIGILFVNLADAPHDGEHLTNERLL